MVGQFASRLEPQVQPGIAGERHEHVVQERAPGVHGGGAGAPLQLVAASAGAAGQEERAALQQPSGFYLVEVVYFSVTNAHFTGGAAFFFRNKFPADVDSPAGLDSALASDPGKGFRSHSEPHIAQSPTNPNLLVAASKMYNRDPDSLAEYEFKIGTYVSFDGGAHWNDLGQLDTCPPGDAPPAAGSRSVRSHFRRPAQAARTDRRQCWF